MRILHIISSVNPKGGGPIEGVRQRGLELIKMGHEVEVVSLDDPQSQFVQQFVLPVYALGPTSGSYQYNAKLGPWLKQNARGYNAIIINGIWQYHSFGAARTLRKMGIPYFVFTHGMLDPWFKHTYPLKHLKKWLYWPWAEYRVLRFARAVLFTSEDERLLARQSFWLYRANEAVVSYGTASPPSNEEHCREVFFDFASSLRNKRIMLFLSRIQEKKGCDLLIGAFARIASQDPSLHLVMAGPDQTGWKVVLESQAQELGIADRITWAGMLQGEIKWGAYYAAEAFVLPSHQENFGIVVAEALACGLPVLISDKINIWREIAEDGAGLVDADTVDGTTRNLQRWLSMNLNERQGMATKARASFQHRFTVRAMASSLLDTIRKNTS